MSRPDRLTGSVGTPFHPVSHYSSPADVLNDQALSPTEKRVILSSWASDMYAADSRPALREIPGGATPMRLADILAALRQLDDEADRPTVIGTIAQASRASAARRPRIVIPKSRWSKEAMVQRYRRLLETQLTEHERRYVEQRLAEELGHAKTTVEASAAPRTAHGPGAVTD